MNIKRLESLKPAPGRQTESSSSDSIWWLTIPTTVKVAGTPHANEWHNVEIAAGEMIQQRKLSGFRRGFLLDEKDAEEDEEHADKYHKNVLTVHHEDMEPPKKNTSKYTIMQGKLR